MFKILSIAVALSLPVATASMDGETERGFTIHSPETAPASTKPVFEKYAKDFGFVPNLGAVMASSPALIQSYSALQENLRTRGLLSQAEINTVQLSIAVENGCQYCTAGHTMAGKMFFKTPDDVMAEIRQQKSLSDPKLRALQTFSRTVYDKRGHVSDQELDEFLKAGYTRGQALDVVACIAAKVMSNYANGLAGTPLDKPLVPFAQGLSFGH